MRLVLGLGLGTLRGGGAQPNPAPTDIAWAGSHTVAEDAALGTVVGGALSYVDPDDTVTFSLSNDAGGLFGVSGTSVIVTGVLDFETATSHNITVRATDSGGNVYDEIFAITVSDVSETAPDDPLPEGDPDDDGTFTNPPVATTVDGAVKLHGKKAAGVLGKFLYDLSAPLAERIYTMRYDPDFSLLTNTGKDAMVGFVFKSGNDFHMAGLRGDGTTGIDAYQLSGDNKWNSGTGLTEDDGGAAAHGTQAGPNWAQIEIASDGSTYTFRTSADGSAWTDEYTDQIPAPFTNSTDAVQFGPGAAFWPTDTGSFSIAIEAWVDASSAAPLAWNSADKSAGMILDQSDISAEHVSGSIEGVRANQAVTGKKVMAFHIDNRLLTGTRLGLAKAAHDLGATGLGSTTDSIAFQTSDGSVIYNNSTITTYSALTAGMLFLLYFDDTGGAGATKFYAGSRTVAGVVTVQGDPVAGTGAAKSDLGAGPWIPVLGNINAGPGDRITMVPVPANAILTGFTAVNPDDSSTIWVPSFWEPLTSNSGDIGVVLTVKMEVPASVLSRSGSMVRTVHEASAVEQCTFSQIAIGEKAGAGDAWDIAALTNAALTFDGGSASKTIAAGTRARSDAKTFTLDETKSYIVGQYFGGAAAADNMRGKSGSLLTEHRKFSVNEVGTENTTGYTTTANLTRGLVAIEVPFVA